MVLFVNFVTVVGGVNILKKVNLMMMEENIKKSSETNEEENGDKEKVRIPD